MNYYKKPQSTIKYDEEGNQYLELLPVNVTPKFNYVDYSQIQNLYPINNVPQQQQWFMSKFNKDRHNVARNLFELGTFPASLNPLAGTIIGGIYGGLAAKDAYQNGLNWSNGIQLGLSLPLVGRGLYTGFNKGTSLIGKYFPKGSAGKYSRAHQISKNIDSATKITPEQPVLTEIIKENSKKPVYLGTFDNSEYRFKPDYLGMNGAPVESSSSNNAIKQTFRNYNSDDFVKYLEAKTGKPIKRVPIKETKHGDLYPEGFSFIDDEGKEIAHIGGSKKGKNIWVESSYVDPEFRHQGLGKQMYFDFNDHIFGNYGTTLHSSPYQRVGSTGAGMSPSNRLWQSLRKNSLSTIEGEGLNKYDVMVEPSKIKTAYSRPKLTEAEKLGIPKGERNQNFPYTNIMGKGDNLQNLSGSRFGKLLRQGAEQIVFQDASNPQQVLKIQKDMWGLSIPRRNSWQMKDSNKVLASKI